MPKLGMTMTEGTIVDWPIAVGASVTKGETVLIIESEKAEIEVEATASGFLRHIYVDVGETAACGALLAALTAAADEPFDVDGFRAENALEESVVGVVSAPRRQAQASASTRAEAVTTVSASRPERKAVAPAARALAKKLGVDVEPIVGSGPGGRVTRADVEARSRAREGLVEVAPGVSLEVPTSGTGDVVLLLPGFGTDVAAFAPQTSELSAGYRVVGINPRGVGLSDAPEADDYAPGVLAADAAVVLEDGPAHVVGASMGAAVAVEMALAYPDKVRSLTLITPAFHASARLSAVLASWVQLSAEASPQALATSLAPWLFSQRVLDDKRARERMIRGLCAIVARTPSVVLDRYARGLLAWAGSRSNDLARIRVPTLVLAGGDDLLAPDSERVAEAVAGATYVVVADAGHALGLEAPDAVNQAMLSHFSRSMSSK